MIILSVVGYSQITVELQPHADEGKDAKVNTLNLWDPGESQEFIASAWTFGGIAGEVRSFIEFDLSFIPAGAQIQNAILCLYTTEPMPSGNHSQLSGSNECWLRRVTEAWNEDDIWWETQPAASTENQIHIPASDDSLQDYEIDVSTMVQDMVNNPGNNYGFMIQLQVEDHYRRLNFASSDHPDSTSHPKLVINYVEEPGPGELLLYYPVEGNANDFSGNNFHGIPQGCTLTTDRCGNTNSAYELDGNDDIIRLPNNLELKPQFPMSVTSWININEFPEQYNCGIFTNDFLEDYYTGIWVACLQSEKIGIGYGNGGVVNPANRKSKLTSFEINTGEWFHLTAVFESAGNMKIYINAMEDPGFYEGGNTDTLIAYSDSAGCIGSKDFNIMTGYFNGKIDEVTYWSKALSQAEIDSIFNAYPETPVSAFDYSKNGLSVDFNNQSVNAFEFSWDFGDGTTSTSVNPTHTYQSQGYYEVSLIASNNCMSDTMIDTLLVCPDVIADYYYTSDSTIAYFRNLSSNADTFYWDFGDGTYSTESNPEHDFMQNGTYYTCLTAANLCGIDTFCDSVTVCEPPNTDFTANIMLYDVYFTNHTDTSFSYLWDFGDGQYSTEKDPVHKYDTAGIYNVCLTANNECGPEVFCDTIFVAPLPLSNFSFNYQAGAFVFENLSNDVISCHWDFGDGATSTEINPVHSYNEPGKYQVCLTVEKEMGFYTSCDSLEVKSGMNIEEILVFPNPVSDIITISSGDMNEMQIMIFNGNGQLVQKYKPINRSLNIDVAELPKGCYFIRAVSKNKVQQARFIKQ